MRKPEGKEKGPYWEESLKHIPWPNHSKNLQCVSIIA